MLDKFWFKENLNSHIKDAYLSQNISKLEDFMSEGYDLNKVIKTNHGLIIDSIDKKLFKNLKFFLANFANEKSIESSIKHSIQTKNKEAEEIIIFFCQKNKIKLNQINNSFKSTVKTINISSKYL